ncbi:MAG: DUF4382 domain-containing protein [Gammaproteobacteria bacterium]|nr:DUF4382 domain-containing protein [Gammaproteobacteria bacterium]
MKKIYLALLLVAVALLSACRSSDSDDSPKFGKIAIDITDAPIDNAEAVVVQFTGIEIQGQGERLDIDFDAPKSIDLLQLTGSDSESILGETQLLAGPYQWIRLKVNAEQNVTDSYIDIEGARYSLYIPSGAQTGLKINRPFVVAAGSITDFTIDFDLRKSVHKPENGSDNYVLRPTLRMVNNLEVGHIKGLVAESFLNGEGCSETTAVYLFAGYDSAVDDMDGVEPDPITTDIVEVNADSLYEYEIGYVEAGDYTLALTCQAANDDPAVDDVIEFINQQNVTVEANQTVEVDF